MCVCVLVEAFRLVNIKSRSKLLYLRHGGEDWESTVLIVCSLCTEETADGSLRDKIIGKAYR